MPTPKLIAPRFDTPAPETSAPDASHGLPDALVSEHIRRLAVCAAVGAGLWTYGLVMDAIVRPITVAVFIPRSILVVETVAIAVSLIMFVYVRYAPDAHARKTDAGLLYVVLNAAAVALLNTLTGLAAVSSGRGLSWNTVVILVAAMILPATPRKMLAASL